MSTFVVEKKSLVVLAGLLEVALPSTTSTKERESRWDNVQECLGMACWSAKAKEDDKLVLSQLRVLLLRASQPVNDLEDKVTLACTVPATQPPENFWPSFVEQLEGRLS